MAAVPLLAARARWGTQGVLEWQAVNDHVLGRAGETNPCGFEAGRAVVDAAWEGDVLVGRVTLCTSCGERTVPYLAVHVAANGTVVADVPLLRRLRVAGAGQGLGWSSPPWPSRTGRPPLTQHLEAGEQLLQLRRGKAAQAEFQKALAAQEDPGKAWQGLGLAAVLLNDPAGGGGRLRAGAELRSRRVALLQPLLRPGPTGAHRRRAGQPLRRDRPGLRRSRFVFWRTPTSGRCAPTRASPRLLTRTRANRDRRR